MSDDRQKAAWELSIFAEFARICPLGIRPDTAQKRKPPEPDVLAELESGEKLAFELAQCEDVSGDIGHSDTPDAIIPKRLIEKIALEKALGKAYGEAVAAGAIEEPERFRCHSITVHFENVWPSKNRREKAAKRVIALLNGQGPGCYTTRYGKVRLHCRPCPIPPPIEGPRFCVPSGSGARPYIVEGVRKKIRPKDEKARAERYNTDHEIHLIAWSTSTTASEFEGLHKDIELKHLLQSEGMGPYQRIWVFGYGEKSILFDSADAESVDTVKEPG